MLNIGVLVLKCLIGVFEVSMGIKGRLDLQARQGLYGLCIEQTG